MTTQLVPVEPTEAMLQAGQDSGKNCAFSYAACYRAMLKAAPPAPMPEPAKAPQVVAEVEYSDAVEAGNQWWAKNKIAAAGITEADLAALASIAHFAGAQWHERAAAPAPPVAPAVNEELLEALKAIVHSWDTCSPSADVVNNARAAIASATAATKTGEQK
jgi:hypothetical protein